MCLLYPIEALGTCWYSVVCFYYCRMCWVFFSLGCMRFKWLLGENLWQDYCNSSKWRRISLASTECFLARLRVTRVCAICDSTDPLKQGEEERTRMVALFSIEQLMGQQHRPHRWVHTHEHLLCRSGELSFPICCLSWLTLQSKTQI